MTETSETAVFSTLSSDVAAGGSKYQRFYIGEQLIEWSIKPGFHWGWEVSVFDGSTCLGYTNIWRPTYKWALRARDRFAHLIALDNYIESWGL